MPMNHVETLLSVNNSVSFIFNILILTVPVLIDIEERYTQLALENYTWKSRKKQQWLQQEQLNSTPELAYKPTQDPNMATILHETFLGAQGPHKRPKWVV